MALDCQQTAASCVHLVFSDRRIDSSQRLGSANRLFIPSADDVSTDFTRWFAHMPRRTSEREWEEFLRSYCMDGPTAEALEANDRTRFLSARQELVQDHLTHFIRRMTEWDFEDTPPLASLDLDDIDLGDDRDDDPR